MNNFKKKISMTDSGWVFVISIFVTAIVSLVLAFLMLGNDQFLADQNTRQWVSGIIAQIIIIGSAVGYSIKNKINLPTAVGAKNPVKLWQVCLLVVLAFTTICFMLPIQTLISNLLEGAGMTPPDSVAISSTADLILALVIVALLPALCEETVYRGFICNSFAAPGKKIDIKAVVISSALFAFMHMSPWQLVHPFVLGCIIAIVYLATRSIWAAAILHFTNNAIVLVLGYVTQGAFEAFIIANWWWVMIIALAIIVPIIWLFAKNARVVEDATEEILSLRIKDRNKSLSCYTAGVVFCLFMFVYTFIG